MGQLIPENAKRKLDNLGRITLPKGLRDRMYLTENAEMELFTAMIDGRHCICLAAEATDEAEVNSAIALLEEKGYHVEH